MGAREQHAKTADRESDVTGQRPTRRHELLKSDLYCRRLTACAFEHVERIGDEADGQEQAVPAGQLHVEGKDVKGEGGEDHDRHLANQQTHLDADRPNERGDAEDQGDVRDVRTDHVADGDIAAAPHRRHEPDEQLGH